MLVSTKSERTMHIVRIDAEDVNDAEKLVNFGLEKGRVTVSIRKDPNDNYAHLMLMKKRL